MTHNNLFDFKTGNPEINTTQKKCFDKIFYQLMIEKKLNLDPSKCSVLNNQNLVKKYYINTYIM